MNRCNTKLNNIFKDADELIKNYRLSLEEISLYNQNKVLEAFQETRINQSHFQMSTGYGYGDIAREGLEEVYARTFKGEGALVRSQISSGTHAIACCLFGLLKPGDSLVSITGTPYDTLHSVIGHKKPTVGSLEYYGIKYTEIALDQETLRPDYNRIVETITRVKPKLVMIQRSRGYQWRPSIMIEEIEQLIKAVKKSNKDTICFVDNCYGEFVEKREPLEVGADLIAGSLIKNPGGGLAAAGGYIVGRDDLVQQAAYRLTAPGIGEKVGASLTDPRLTYQGFFMAPHTVKEALLTASYIAALFKLLGFTVAPDFDAFRTDIIQAIQLESPAMMVAICKALQASSPVESYITPEPSPMAGYDTSVVMAGGTFVQGSSIELSADGPIVEPYILYLQGALSFEHGKLAINKAVTTLHDQGLLAI